MRLILRLGDDFVIDGASDGCQRYDELTFRLSRVLSQTKQLLGWHHGGVFGLQKARVVPVNLLPLLRDDRHELHGRGAPVIEEWQPITDFAICVGQQQHQSFAGV